MPKKIDPPRNVAVLFKRQKKFKESQPDYSGAYKDPDGNLLKCNIWVKVTKHGGTCLVFKTELFTPEQESQTPKEKEVINEPKHIKPRVLQHNPLKRGATKGKDESG